MVEKSSVVLMLILFYTVITAHISVAFHIIYTCEIVGESNIYFEPAPILQNFSRVLLFKPLSQLTPYDILRTCSTSS